MDICGEHGEEIVYYGRECPACNQIDEMRDDHRREIEDMQFSHEEEVDSLNEKIYDLENK